MPLNSPGGLRGGPAGACSGALMLPTGAEAGGGAGPFRGGAPGAI
jgi:hypothetical protein